MPFAHHLKQLVGGDQRGRVAAGFHALRDTIQKERLAQPRLAHQNEVRLHGVRIQVGVFLAQVAQAQRVRPLAHAALFDRLVRDARFVEGGEVLRVKRRHAVAFAHQLAQTLFVARAGARGHAVAHVAAVAAHGAVVLHGKEVRRIPLVHQLRANLAVQPKPLLAHFVRDGAGVFAVAHGQLQAGGGQRRAGGHQLPDLRALRRDFGLARAQLRQMAHLLLVVFPVQSANRVLARHAFSAFPRFIKST